MQDPNADTEWNDVLRAKGILPPKQKEAEVSEDELIALAEQGNLNSIQQPRSPFARFDLTTSLCRAQT